MEAVAKAFANQGVAYRLVYVTEAHPTDGWMAAYAPQQFKHVAYASRIQERLATASAFAKECAVDAHTVLVDGMDDELEHAYEARPERLYVVGQGKVLWRCGPGPFEYDVNGLDAFLRANASRL